MNLRFVALSLALVACQSDDPNDAPSTSLTLSPRERCEAEAAGECCSDDDCAGGSICDFDYLCSPARGGGIACSEPSGGRACHATCAADQENNACPGAGTCTEITRFRGGDFGRSAFACF